MNHIDFFTNWHCVLSLLGKMPSYQLHIVWLALVSLLFY